MLNERDSTAITDEYSTRNRNWTYEVQDASCSGSSTRSCRWRRSVPSSNCSLDLYGYK